MAIQGVPSNNLAALNKVLSQIGKAMDEKSPDGLKVNDVEAEKIIGAMNQLPSEVRTLAQSALQTLLTDRFIEVTDSGREKFAKAMNVELRALTPKETAELAGHALLRTAFSATMKAVAKTPQADRKWMNTFLEGAKATLSEGSQKWLAGVLLNASKDGVIKLDTDARKLFTKWMGGLNQEGAVTKTAEKLAEGPSDAKMTAFQRALAAGGFFEDFLAAFMFGIVSDIKDEIKETTRQFDAGEDAAKNGAKTNKMGELAERLSGKTTTGPDGKPAPVSKADLQKTKADLEGLVQSASVHFSNDGYIDRGEATKIAARMAKLDEPVARMLAGAFIDAVRRSELDATADNLAPLVDWAKGTMLAAGEQVDMSKLPPRSAEGARDGMAAGMRDSDRLENRLASFLLEQFMSSNAPIHGPMQSEGKIVSDNVKKFREVFDGVSESDKENLAAQVAASHASATKPLPDGADGKPQKLPAILGEIGLGRLNALFTDGARTGPSPLSPALRKEAEAKLSSILGGTSPEVRALIKQQAGAFPNPLTAKTPADAEKIVKDSIAMLEKGVPEIEASLKQMSPEAKDALSSLTPPVTEEKLAEIAEQAAAKAPDAATQTPEERQASRQELFEQLKKLQNQLSEIMQAISNILSSMNQNAMNSIRGIR